MSLFGGPISTRIQCMDTSKLEALRQKEAEAAAREAARAAAAGNKGNSSGSQRSKPVPLPSEPPKKALKQDLYAFDDLDDDTHVKPAAKTNTKSISPSPPPTGHPSSSSQQRPAKAGNGSAAAGQPPRPRTATPPTSSSHGHLKQRNGNDGLQRNGHHHTTNSNSRFVDKHASGMKPGSSGPGRPGQLSRGPASSGSQHTGSHRLPGKPPVVHTSMRQIGSPAAGRPGMNGSSRQHPQGRQQGPPGRQQGPGPAGMRGHGPGGAGKPAKPVIAPLPPLPAPRVSSLIHSSRPAPQMKAGQGRAAGHRPPGQRPPGRYGAGGDDDDDSYEEDDFVVGDDEEPDWRREMDRLLGPRKKRMYMDDDYDDRSMEVGWREITREEGRSAALARLEDQREQAEEERRLEAKRQKLARAR